MRITLRRSSLGPVASEGVVEIGALRLYTLEDALGGEAEGEPVPAGVYQLKPHDSAKYGKVWAMVNPVLGVYHQPADRPNGVGRFACLFAHSGNTDKDTLGCVLVGLARGKLEGKPAVLSSKAAVAALKDALPWEPHELEIVNP